MLTWAIHRKLMVVFLLANVTGPIHITFYGHYLKQKAFEPALQWHLFEFYEIKLIFPRT